MIDLWSHQCQSINAFIKCALNTAHAKYKNKIEEEKRKSDDKRKKREEQAKKERIDRDKKEASEKKEKLMY